MSGVNGSFREGDGGIAHGALLVAFGLLGLAAVARLSRVWACLFGWPRTVAPADGD